MLLELDKSLEVFHVSLATQLIKYDLISVIEVVKDEILDHVLCVSYKSRQQQS